MFNRILEIELNHTYGQALDVQNEILLKMTNVISDLRVKGKTFLLPFQKSKDFLL